MSLTTTVRAMVLSGATPEMILAVVEAHEVERLEKESDRLSKGAERQRRYRESRHVTSPSVSNVTNVTSTAPLDAPLDGGLSLSPAPLSLSNLNPPLNPPTNKKSKAGAGKPKISLDELTVDHNAEWLAEKRSQGRYIHHDEHFVLEQFKQQCQAKGYKYEDYRAAYRNAFEWDKCQPKGKPAVIGQSDWTTAADQIIASDRAKAAKLSGGTGAVHTGAEPSLHSLETVR